MQLGQNFPPAFYEKNTIMYNIYGAKRKEGVQTLASSKQSVAVFKTQQLAFSQYRQSEVGEKVES